MKIEKFKLNSVEEFISLKKEPFFNLIRQQAKVVSLAFLFGRGAQSFAIRDLDVAWDDDRIESFIEDNDLEEKLNRLTARQKDFTLRQCKLIVCAAFIRERFFITYPGLMERIKANREFVREHGYIRSVYGAMRRIPEFLLSGSDDREQYGDLFAGLDNIATNTDIQNFESAAMNRPIAIIDEWLLENNMRSYFVSQVHDSLTLVVHRDEFEVVFKKVKEEMERWHPEFWELGLVAEEKVGDVRNDIGYYLSGPTYDKYLTKIKK
jgi:hypothetical protein